MYTVIGHPKSRTIRVIWALEEMGLPYKLNPANPHSDAAFAATPTGKIPSLITDEGTISDSIAILTFLADRHGQLTAPAGTYARAVQDSRMNHIVAEIDAACWTFAKHRFALPEDHRITAMRDVAAFEFTRAMAQMEQLKGDAAFVAGDQFTIADIVLSHCAGWAMSNGFAIPKGPFADFLKSLRKRPAMDRTFATFPQDG